MLNIINIITNWKDFMIMKSSRFPYKITLIDLEEGKYRVFIYIQN